MTRDEYLDEIRPIREDMIRGCDRYLRSPLCKRCNGTVVAEGDAHPPTCVCEDEEGVE